MSRESFDETISNAREALTHIDKEEPTQLPLHLRKPTNGDCATCALVQGSSYLTIHGGKS